MKDRIDNELTKKPKIMDTFVNRFLFVFIILSIQFIIFVLWHGDYEWKYILIREAVAIVVALLCAKWKWIWQI